MIEIKEWNQQLYLGNEFDSSKTTLLFLHGFPDNFRVWDKVCEQLDDSFNLICPSAPGTATDKSDLSNDYRLENLSKYYREILSFGMSELTPVTIVAHDMGGPYAHHMLNFLPGETKLICINTLSGQMLLDRKFNLGQMVRSSYMSLFQMPFVNKKMLGRYWYDLRKSAARIGRSSVLNIPDSYTENILNGFHFYKSLLRDIPKFLDGKTWSNQVHYIWSSDDPFLVRPIEKEMNKRYSNWKIDSIASGHWPMLDEHDVLASMIKTIHIGVSNE
jgi:pimeloyl-ACP methyl ester carboxylesterase